jgi:hypothetical protein
MTARIVCVLVLVLVLLAGCGSGGDADAEAAPRLHGPVHYVRSGGFAGVMDELRLRRDGSATVRHRSGTRTKLKATRRQLTRIARALDGFADIPEDSGSPQPAADAFVYTVTYRGHTVRTDETSGGTRIKRVIAALEAVLTAAGRRP